MKAHIAVVAALGITVAPVAAAAAPATTGISRAASLSVAHAPRAAAPARKGESLRGQTGRFLIGGAVVAAIVAGIFIAADQIGSDDPDSN